MQSFVIHDQAHQSHTLSIGEETLLLDGMVAEIVALEDNQVVLVSSSGTVVFPYIALAIAILGERPTLTVVGQLLVLYLSRWSALQTCMASLKRLQVSIGPIMTEAQPWLQTPLPAYQFDEITRRALAAFDGTEETTRTISRILDQAPETVIAWAHQIGKAVLDTPALSSPSIDEQPAAATHRHEEKAAQAVMEPPGRRFRWTPEQVQQLEDDFLNSPIKGVVVCMRDIAERRGWPYNSIQSKLYELKLPQQKEQKKSGATQRETETSSPKEDHLSEPVTANDASSD